MPHTKVNLCQEGKINSYVVCYCVVVYAFHVLYVLWYVGMQWTGWECVYLSIYLSVYLSICPCLSTYLSLGRNVCMSIFLSIMWRDITWHDVSSEAPNAREVNSKIPLTSEKISRFTGNGIDQWPMLTASWFLWRLRLRMVHLNVGHLKAQLNTRHIFHSWNLGKYGPIWNCMCVLLRLKFQPSQAVTLRRTVVGILHAVCSNSYLQLFGYLGGGAWAQECQSIPRGTFSLLEASDLSAARLGDWSKIHCNVPLGFSAWVKHCERYIERLGTGFFFPWDLWPSYLATV
jgi:hypothetical protein